MRRIFFGDMDNRAATRENFAPFSLPHLGNNQFGEFFADLLEGLIADRSLEPSFKLSWCILRLRVGVPRTL